MNTVEHPMWGEIATKYRFTIDLIVDDRALKKFQVAK